VTSSGAALTVRSSRPAPRAFSDPGVFAPRAFHPVCGQGADLADAKGKGVDPVDQEAIAPKSAMAPDGGSCFFWRGGGSW